MTNYILHTILFQVLFLLFYDTMYKRDTFFTLNRMYLTGTLVASLLLPIIQIDLLRQAIPSQYIISLPEVIVGASIQQTSFIPLSPVLLNPNEPSTPWFIISYLSGACFFIGFFIHKLLILRRLRKEAIKTSIDGFTIYILKNSNDAFSFNRSIYLGDQLNETQKPQIIAHELVHIKERHTLDLVGVELLRIIFWFNPLLYLYRSRLSTLHEYIADTKCVALLGKKAYYQQLLNTVFETENIQFINQFFNYSLIKKRIIKLQKSKSNRILRLKYVALLPLIATMLLYISCSSESSEDIVSNAEVTQTSLLIQNLQDKVKEKGLTQKEKSQLLDLLKNHSNDESNFDLAKDVPFNLIDKVPTSSNCGDVNNNAEHKAYVSKQFKTFINNNFDVATVRAFAKTGDNKIYVRFKIDNTGEIVDVEARAATLELENEAKRVVRSLPTMIPGEHQGKKVGVLYSLPIILNIDGNAGVSPISYKDARLAKKDSSIDTTFYVITNVLKDESYLEKQLETLKEAGFTPGFFQNERDGYFYVYLSNHTTMETAKSFISKSSYAHQLYVYTPNAV
ncbi:M56 family metallopeptidase [Aquimarina intermedia]|uniref:BlaR1 peptidase M56 n=1 Tax=Aquimarina intermedia TaxID=350814 RepID=A0A5S5CFC8_9FLAO|nr:M56 family metallopeptidase [Aquimarina intermedia]TYP77222.1 BlaR1 peptidase M56 [Aquimarina intermedia]